MSAAGINFWANLVGYQLVWFSAVVGAGRGHVWPGVLAAIVFAAMQLGFSRQRTLEARVALAAVLCGMLVDGVLAAMGLLQHAAAWPWCSFAPIWILALWAAFGLTLNSSLALLQRHLWLAALMGAIGGPLAYLGAGRGWGAVTFAEPLWLSLGALALGWSIALPLLSLLARRWREGPRAAAPALPGGQA